MCFGLLTIFTTQNNINMKKFFLIAAGIMILAVSCNNEGNEKKSQQRRDSIVKDGVFAMKMNEVIVKDASCDSLADNCAHVLINYPVFIENSMGAANELISKRIVKLLGQKELDNNSDIKVAADNFIKEYANFKTENPDSKQFWNFRLKSRVSFSDNEQVCILFASEVYTGGAHASQNQMYMNFDINGNLLKAEDYISNMNKFKIVAEQNFRMRKGMKEGQTYSEAGFNFPDDKFTLPENIGIADSLYILHYNPYEIAPYSTGPTQLIIKMDEIK